MNETPCEHTDPSLLKKDYGSLLGKDVLYYLPVKLFPAITGLLSIYILTHKLEPGEYGTYSVVITTALLFTQLASSWLSNSVLYVYPEYVKEHNVAFQIQVLKIQAIAAVPAASIAYIVLLLMTHDHLLAIIGSLLLVLQMFQVLMQTFLQSTRQVISQVISVGVQSFTQLTILSTFVFLLNGKVTAALTAVSAGYGAAILVLLIQGKAFRFNKSTCREMDSKALFNKLFSYGMPMCIWFFATQFYTVGDRLLLKMFNVTDTLGQYASFRDLATGCAGFLTMPLLMASHPIIMAMWKEGRDRTDIEELMSRNMVMLLLMFIPLLVLMDLCGSELITLVLGQKYVLNKFGMLMVVVSILLACFSMYIQKGLEVTGRTLVLAKTALVAVAISLIGNIMIIRWYGINGSASVVIVAQIVYLVIVRKLTVHTLSPSLPSYIAKMLFVWAACVEVTFRVLPHISIKLQMSLFINTVYSGVAIIAVVALAIICKHSLKKANNTYSSVKTNY